MKDPAFLFYSSDFLTGTALLTYEETGKYIKLLCHMHQHGALKKEQMELLVGNLSDNLMLKFSLNKDGSYIHERLFCEIEKRKKFTQSRSENGKKGGRKPLALPNDKPLVLASENLHKDENENINDIVNIWTYDFNFLKLDSVWFEQQIEMKYRIPTKDLDHMLSQYWLSLQKSNFSGNLKQIRAGLIKWINTWLEKNKTEKPQEQKRTVKVLS
jgi:hypothetical protein